MKPKRKTVLKKKVKKMKKKNDIFDEVWKQLTVSEKAETVKWMKKAYGGLE